jgi:hypothetical protein
MDRRGFLSGLAVVGTGAAVVALGVETGQIRVDDYVPCGLLTADSYGAVNADYVTLNGKRVDGVFECNDVEGWLRRYAEPDGQMHRVEYLTGTVRVHWKPI